MVGWPTAAAANGRPSAGLCSGWIRHSRPAKPLPCDGVPSAAAPFKWSRRSCLGSYPGADSAEHVRRTLHNGSLLRADSAGRGARMVDVCSGDRTYHSTIHSLRRKRSNHGLKRRRGDTRTAHSLFRALVLRVPKPRSKSIRAAAAFAANASGSVQTTLSKVTRRSALSIPQESRAASLPIEC